MYEEENEDDELNREEGGEQPGEKSGITDAIGNIGSSIGGAISGKTIEVGTEVEVDIEETDEWTPAVIDKKHEDGTFDVKYENGDVDVNIEKDYIRIKSSEEGAAAETINVGTTVEVKRGAEDEWTPGVVKAINEDDDTLDIEYEDKKIDKGVSREDVRILKSTSIQWGKLLLDIVMYLVELLILFIIGSRVVFATKIAQFNILPTDIDCMPYHPASNKNKSPEFISNSPEADIDLLYMRAGSEIVTYATRIMYEINNETRKDYILDKIRKIEYDPKVGTFVKYMLVCITQLYVFFYGLTTSIFKAMNTYLYEFLVIILGPSIIALFLMLAIPVSMISAFIIAIVNFKWLLKSNMNNNPDYPHRDDSIPVWRDTKPFSDLTDFLWTALYVFLGFYFVFLLPLTPIPLLISIMCFFTPMFMKAYIVSGDATSRSERPEYGFGSSIRGLIETKMDVFMILFGIMTILATHRHAPLPAVIMVTLATAYFLYLQITTPKKIPAFATKDLVGIEQNKKFCPKPILTKEELAKMKQQDSVFDERMKEQFDKSPIGKTIGDISAVVEQKTGVSVDKNKKPVIVTPDSLPRPSMSVTKNDTTADNAYNKSQGSVGKVGMPQVAQGIAQVTPTTGDVSSIQPNVPVTSMQNMAAKNAVPVVTGAVTGTATGSNSSGASDDKNAIKGAMTGGRRNTLERKLNAIR